ncbi:MAG: arginine--tRNA ligase [Bacteroidetes bacterium]|nr:arginine--tRNA ligase [Bacteroidota bacterium]
MQNYIYKQLLLAIKKLNYPLVEFHLEKPRLPTHGDVSCTVVLTLAKMLSKPPREIASAIVNNLLLDNSIIKSVEIAGAGFLNFRFADSAIIEESKNILKLNNNFGKSDLKKNKKVNLEWVSANPTGPLHSGHGRQVCLGGVIANLLEWIGYDVTREYYFNNAGNQMKLLADSIFARYNEVCGLKINFPENGYQGLYIQTIAEEIKNKFGSELSRQSLDGNGKPLFQTFGEEWCFENIKKTLHKLNIHHDLFYNEDSLYSSGKIDDVISQLRQKDLIYEEEGALWFRTTKFGFDKDRVVVKSTGEPTYRLPDIAYHREKFVRGFDLLVDIFGADHIATIPDVLAGIEALGFDKNKVKVIIHQMVSFVDGEEVVKMSKRNAKVYTLDELINDVGIDAVYYFFIMRSANTHLEFDILLAKKQSEENPLYYVQYAHARIASILRFAEDEKIKISPNELLQFSKLNLIEAKEEIDLLKVLLEFPLMIESSAEMCEPHRLPTYLHQVAEAFHRFYHNHRVISENKNLTIARVALCLMTKIVLSNSFKILNVSAPERM